MKRAESAVKSDDFAPREIKPIPMNAVALLEASNVRWRVNLPQATVREDLDNPALYSVVSGKFRPYDTLECVGAGFWAEVMVIYAEKGFTPILQVLRVVDVVLPQRGPSDYAEFPPGHAAVYDTQKHKWRAKRLSDNVWMTPDLDTREECRRAVVDHASLR